ncbi:MAG TPA: PsiF family protein [Burkholderiales bacterium]|nr:PsiF family protein [Burkholderiales bacterium]
MKAILAALCTLSIVVATPALGQDKKDEKKAPSVAQKKQQERMRDCNKKATERALTGDERKNFVSACLRSAPAATTAKGEKMTPQQARMRDCNKKAADRALKGDERKNFMSACLKS